jgi:hypothetical protein
MSDTPYTDLIDVDRTDGNGHVNRWVPEMGENHKAVAIRQAEGSLFVQVKANNSTVKYVQLTREEMIAFGIACIRTATDKGED